MKKILQIIVIAILFSCEGKEQPILHYKTIPFLCDNEYHAKIINNSDINIEHIITSDNGKSFYTITGKGIIRYSIDNLKKEWEKSYDFINIGYSYFVRSDKKIWITSHDEPRNVSGPFANYKVYLIDTTGYIIYKRNVHRGYIVGDNNNGFILAYNEYDSIEWFNHHIYVRTDKYFVESYNESGNLLWKNSYNLAGGEIECLYYLSTNEILIGGYSDSYYSGKAYLTKLDDKGILKWDNTYVSNYNGQNYSVKSILEKSPQLYNIILGGTEYSFNLLEIDSTGLKNWDTALSGYFYRNEHLLYTNDTYMVLYSNQNDIKMTCLNSSGIVLWSNTYGGTGIETASSINALPSYDFYITGITKNWDGVNYDPFFSDYFIKIDKDGKTCY